MNFVPLPSGTTLNNGRYKIEDRLAVGGQGTVYKAIDLHYNRDIAIKQVITKLQKADPAHEWRLLSSLFHQSLPEVYEHFSQYITSEKCGFLVMEFIPGPTLDDMLDQWLKRQGRPFPLFNALKWADQLLDVLDTLHTQAQIIHRDIKPENLKLTADGRIILLDFGLAKFVAKGTEFYGKSRYYSSPEQWAERPTDARSDLYSLAATLYHFIIGEPPPNGIERLSLVNSGDRDIVGSKINSAAPRIIADALQRALSLDPRDRFSTAQEMREALFLHLGDSYEIFCKPEYLECDILAEIKEDDLQSTRAEPRSRRIEISLTPDDQEQEAPVISLERIQSAVEHYIKAIVDFWDEHGIRLHHREKSGLPSFDRSDARNKRLNGSIGIVALAIIVVAFWPQTSQLMQGLGRSAEYIWIYVTLDIQSFETEVNNGRNAEAFENFIDKNRGKPVWINTLIAVACAEITEGKNSTSLCVAAAPLEVLRQRSVVPCSGFTFHFDGTNYELREHKGYYWLYGYFVIDRDISAHQKRAYRLTGTARWDIGVYLAGGQKTTVSHTS